MNWFNWKRYKSVSRNCLHVNHLESCLTYEELFRDCYMEKYTVFTVAEKFYHSCSADYSPQSRQISPTKSDFVSEQLFYCPLICAKKWCLGLGVKVRSFSLTYGVGQVGLTGQGSLSTICLIICPVVPLHWHCSVSEAVLLLLPPVSGPFGILFPNTDS